MPPARAVSIAIHACARSAGDRLAHDVRDGRTPGDVFENDDGMLAFEKC